MYNEANKAEQIRNRYVEKEQTKLDELKALDLKVRRPPQIFAYVFGSLSALVLGTGMCLAMKVIGNSMALGVVVGVAGIGLCSLTYPLYKKILSSRKKKYAKQIFELSNEILHQ